MKITLSIYPNKRGFGFVVMEGPRLLVDYGQSTVLPASNAKMLYRFKKVMEYHKPSVVVLRDQSVTLAKRGKRIVKLIEAITTVVKDNGIPLHRYSREQVKNVFEQFGASTKYQIAHKIMGEFEELKTRAPKPSKAWMDEDYNMGIFDAMAILATHNFLTNQHDII